MPRVLLFDVNETLLDLAVLDAPFAQAFGEAAVRQEWFAEMLRQALISAVTERYVDFSTLAEVALEITARRKGAALAAADREAILEGMRALPPHPEVPESLERLRASGLRLAALTNSTAEAARAKLIRAGLYDLFEQVLSADAVQRLKPAPEPYRMAAERLGVETRTIRFVAAHDWDIAGAMRVGCRGAFIARAGKALGPLIEAPEIVGPDLSTVADEILRLEAAS